MARNLIQLIEGHPTLRHPLFEKMASADRLSPEFLALFLREMGAFCAASRGDLFWLADSLLGHNELEVTLTIREIARSETGHGPQFEAMAAAIVNDSDSTVGHWLALESTTIASRHFDARRARDERSVMRSLGVLVAVELLAHRHIIPGEMRVFIESGRFSIDDPRMAYLAEHAGECGAEAEHESLVLEAIVPLEERYGDDMIAGARDFLDDVGRWYIDLHSYLGP